jgi:hypothetical protein
MTTTTNLWEFLEQDTHYTATKDLFQWSLNFDHGSRPFDLFLDLIGWSQENYGTKLHTGDYESTIRHAEADYLALALREWAWNGSGLERWIDRLMACED